MPGELLQTGCGSAVFMEQWPFKKTPSLGGTRSESFQLGNQPPSVFLMDENNRTAFPLRRSKCAHSAVGQFQVWELQELPGGL